MRLPRPFGQEYAHRRGWSRLERAYVRAFGSVDLPTRIRAAVVLGALDGARPTRVLDYGTGTGVYALRLSRDAGTQVVATDVDGDRIRELDGIARAIGRHNLATIEGGESALHGLPDASFSTVLAIEVLVYVPDVERVLREMHRILEPGGLLVAHVPIRERLFPHEQRLLDDAAVRALLEGAGFRDVTIRPTFTAPAMALCSAYERLSSRRALLAAGYPFLLLAAALLPPFGRTGAHRLVTARKPPSGG